MSVEVSNVEPPRGYWHFVPVKRFLEPRLEVVIVEREEVPVLYERTEVLGPVVVQNNTVVNNVIEVNFIEENTDEEVTVVNVETVDDPQAAQQGAEGGTIRAFTAELSEPTEEVAPAEAVEPQQVEAPPRASGRAADQATSPAPKVLYSARRRTPAAHDLAFVLFFFDSLS